MPSSGIAAPSGLRLVRLLCALVALGGAITSPLMADDKGKEQIEKTIQAYQDTKLYESHVVITLLQDAGRIKNTETGDYNLSFDRQQTKLLSDRTDCFMVISEGNLQVKSDQLPGKFAKVDAPNPFTFEELIKITPFAKNIVQPDLLYLTSVMPTIYIGGRIIETKAFDYLPPRADDPAKRPGIKATIGEEELTYWIDPATNLITQIVRTPGPNIKNPTKFITTYDIQIKAHNKDLPKTAFDFDAKGLTQVNGIDAWIGAPAQPNAQANAQPGAAGAPANAPAPGPAAGAANPQAAPEAKLPDPNDIVLKTLEDKDLKLTDIAGPGKVVVFTFWESWAKSCQQAMPKMQTVSQWITDSKISASYYAVNIREDPKDVQAFLTQNKLTLPVLLDTEGKASQYFIVNNLPKTVIIVNGKEVKSFTGLSPNMDREIKSAVQEAIKRAQRQEKNPQGAPTDPSDPSKKSDAI
jgi:thiol-disulfide isomerase/thioredoxin